MGGASGDDLLAETEDQAALRQLARDVATREVAPRAHQADEEGAVPAELRKALAAADLLRITIGEEWGGMGLGDVEASIVLEEIARADVSSAICCRPPPTATPSSASASPSPTPARPCRT
jgi:alkylation response protein AidB-like acyl-CoA dehydrogenase